LPWLDHLIRFSNAAADNTDRIFEADPWDFRIQQKLDEFQGFLLLCELIFEPTGTGNSQMSTRRMTNHEVKTATECIQDVSNVPHEVRPRYFAGQNVA
jgi:hypothetical protein